MIRLPAAVSAAGLLWAAAGFAVAEDPKPASPGAGPQAQKINEFIAKGYESAGIKKPAEKATDFEFMRRAFIDLIGRIPTPEEVIDFEADKTTNKRAKLINRLLNEDKYKLKDRFGKTVAKVEGIKTHNGEIDYNDAYAENFAELWTTWMLTRSNTNPDYRKQLRFWLASSLVNNGIMFVHKDGKLEKVSYPNGASWDKIVYHAISETGKSDEVGAVVFVIRHLGEPISAEQGQKPDFTKDGKFDAVPITSRVTKLFLGIQSQCTQCHDHPFNKEYVQPDFWGVNAFFRQTERSGTTNPRNLAAGISAPPLTLTDVGGWNNTGMVLYERRDGQRKATYPVMLKDIKQAANGETSTKRLVSPLPMELEGKTRRQILAQWVTEHDNFGKAFVNRMWGHLFGRGLNKEPTVDDFSSNNEVVHPELLDYLAEEFKKYNYDPKRLLEWICTSDVYQLSHVANKAYVDQKYDPFFARMPLKALSPEVLFESLSVATAAETRKDEKTYRALKDAWINKLTQNFGDDEGNEINFNGTVVQALLMMNGKELNAEVSENVKNTKDANKGVVADMMRRHLQRGQIVPGEIYNELYLMTVSRRPTSAEIAKLEDVRNGRAVVDLGAPGPASTPTPKGGKPAPKNPSPKSTGGLVPIPATIASDVAFYQDVFWALLNSNEFMLNH